MEEPMELLQVVRESESPTSRSDLMTSARTAPGCFDKQKETRK